MNKQRKVVITTTYNEMGIIIDTKAEEVAQPNLQPTCNQLATDCISRQAAIELCDWYEHEYSEVESYFQKFNEELKELPSAQPERKTGQWVNGFCSICEKEAVTEWNENGGEYLLSDFCPFCGADTREAKRMSNLIDRQAAISLDKDLCVPTKDGTVYRHRCIDPDAIRELPSAQPEITHCAECIHWKHSAVRKSYCEVFDWTNTAEDFCSFAERRKE